MTITDEMVERAAKAIGAIESKTNGYVELYPEPLRNKISAPLLDKIARTALHEQAQEIERLNVQVSLRHNAYLEGTARIAELEAENDAAHGLARTYLAWSHKAEAERDEAKDDYLRRHKDVGDQMDRRIKAEAERDAIRKAERALSDAYVRLRVMIPGALDTPHAPTSEQIWNITEKALSRYAAAIRAKTIEGCAKTMDGMRSDPNRFNPDPYQAGYDGACEDGAEVLRALAQTDEGKTESGE